MKTTIFKITAILLMVAASFSACCNEPEDVFTKTFYVLAGDPWHWYHAECGYLLIEGNGNPYMGNGRFVRAQNLPEEFQILRLPVLVTFRYVERGDCREPIINIIRIRKR